MAEKWAQVLVRMPDGLRNRLRAAVGSRGIAPLMRDLAERWLAETEDPAAVAGADEALPPTGWLSATASNDASKPCPHPKRRIQKGQCQACAEYVG